MRDLTDRDVLIIAHRDPDRARRQEANVELHRRRAARAAETIKREAE